MVNTRNNGALDFMGYNDVVEIGCRVNKDGVTPIPLKSFDNEHIKEPRELLRHTRSMLLGRPEGDYGSPQSLNDSSAGGDYTKAKSALMK